MTATPPAVGPTRRVTATTNEGLTAPGDPGLPSTDEDTVAGSHPGERLCTPANENEQADGDHASSRTDPDDAERLTGIYGSHALPARARSVPERADVEGLQRSPEATSEPGRPWVGAGGRERRNDLGSRGSGVRPRNTAWPGAGYSSQVRPSSRRPPTLGVSPPTCLKNSGIRMQTQRSRRSRTQPRSSGRKSGPFPGLINDLVRRWIVSDHCLTTSGIGSLAGHWSQVWSSSTRPSASGE